LLMTNRVALLIKKRTLAGPYRRLMPRVQWGFCGGYPLVAVPHTSMCIGVDSFAEENRSPLHVRAYISL
jgi:hypothetical protein